MQSHLAISISEQGAEFISFKEGIVVNNSTLEFASLKADECKRSLDDHFRETHFLTKDYAEITLSWVGIRSTVVPANVFADSNPEDIFKLCFGKNIDPSTIDYNRISEQSIVNIYEIPRWVKSFFVIKYPTVILQHEGSHLIRSAMDSNAFKTKATIILHKEHFTMTIAKHNELIYYSGFEASAPNDVLYHLLFVLQQKEITEDKGSIEISLDVDANELWLEEITTGISKIKDISSFTVSNVDNYMAKAQRLCV